MRILPVDEQTLPDGVHDNYTDVDDADISADLREVRSDLPVQGGGVMGVYIKGMEMPQSCMNCMFCGFAGANCELDTCLITGNAQKHIPHSKMPDCPLIEVPPHGRLIDADKMIEKYEELIERSKDGVIHMTYHDVIVEAIYDLKQAPIVIPADIGKVFEKFFGKDNDKDINVPCKTNADRIRAMTDEALASFLCTISNCCVGNCLGEKHCSFDNGNGYLEWLKKEVKDGT